jgi:hypothetical protein
MNNLNIHLIEQTLFPDDDKPQWMAYLILNARYPNLTYLSMDGYHCHGIADYSENKMFYWQGYCQDGVLNWRDKSLISSPPKDFCDMSTEEIISVWMGINGETDDSKRKWLNNLRGKK